MRAQGQSPRHRRPHSGAQFLRAPHLAPFVSGYRATIVAPANGAFTRDRRPDITVKGEYTVGGTVDLQVEWRNQLGGPLVYTSTFLGAVSGTNQVVEPPADLAFYNWYYRARAGNATTNTWSAYTGTQFLTIYPVPGFAHAYIDANIGVENVDPVLRTLAYADLNVGLAAFDQRDVVAYAEFNVGLEEKPRIGAEYLDLNIVPTLGAFEPATFMDMNVVTNETPTPHIWYVQPQIGPEGLMFKIVGQGFGAFQGEYDGRVVLGDLDCPIVSWTNVPEGASQVTRISKTNVDDSSVGPYTMKPAPSYSSPNAVTFAPGDYLELEYRRLSPVTYLASEFYWHPYFQLRSPGNSLFNTNWTNWFDQYGVNILDRVDIPVGEVQKRIFHIPTVFETTDFRAVGLGWMYTGTGSDGRPAHVVEIRNYVYKRADGTPVLWVFGEDGSPITITNAYSLIITQGVSGSFDAFIDQGATNKAHQEILALVPDGADSGMVQVILGG